MKTFCGCCDGIQAITPQPIANRPGLDALAYRVGTHAGFLETLLARLSNFYFEKPDESNTPGQANTTQMYPLRGLTTREPTDPTIALLDAWSMVADVLTFYQERIANEGYLRTATERRSILELARLIGYELRPGVAAGVYLAYELEKNTAIDLAQGARVQSLPGPGELPQSFETFEPLNARFEWNAIKPRLSRPQTAQVIQANQRIFLQGIATNLKPNAPLLIDTGSGIPAFVRVDRIETDPLNDRTLVILQMLSTASGIDSPAVPASSSEQTGLQALIQPLILPPSLQPANATRLTRSVHDAFTAKSDINLQLLAEFKPVLRQTLLLALANAQVTMTNPIRVYALRVTAPLFGGQAPARAILETDPNSQNIKKVRYEEWQLSDIRQSEDIFPPHTQDEAFSATVFLDTGYDKILPESWIVIDTGAVDKKNPTLIKPTETPILIAKTKHLQAGIARSAYGISGKTTRIELADPMKPEPKPWFEISPSDIGVTATSVQQTDDFQIIRRTLVYAQSEELPLAEEPVATPIGACRSSTEASKQTLDGTLQIEVDALYHGLDAGRWLIVSGERLIPGTSGVKASELVMLAGVNQDTQTYEKTGLPGDKIHTFLQLAKPLAYCYKRDTVTLYANVVKATHGETRHEVLGSGDGSKTLQPFTLRQPPLTWLSAANPAGIQSSLEIRVNEVQWQETDSLSGLEPNDRKFITRTDNEGKTTVVFGNGREGARLPTGVEDVRAVYRNGIGKLGNVKAGQISLLTTRPLGVKGVTNPLAASGGADAESRDQARKNAPLAVQALDRLVSTQDYADFARTFAGIGKAYAERLADGRVERVYLTLAGAEDAPIDEHSDLYRNLTQALQRYGDPHQPFKIVARELVLLIVSARVYVLPDYQWESVAPKIRAALLDAFGFERRELGQDALLSEVISVIQRIPGVNYVDVDLLDGIAESVAYNAKALREKFATLAAGTGQPKARIRADLPSLQKPVAQLAVLSPDLPATLILNGA